MKIGLILFLWISLAIISDACATEQPKAVKIEDLNWDDEAQQALTRIGRQALKIQGVEWNHGQTEHFIYHFTQHWMADAVATEVEPYYAAIKKDLKIEDDHWEIPCQVFIFDSEAAWKDFYTQVGMDPWVAAFYSRNEIFVPRPSRGAPFVDRTLPHELTHLVLDHFLRGRVPVWLNEGVAEEQGYKHFLASKKTKGFNMIVPPGVVSATHYVPVSELTSVNDYPAEVDRIRSFYTESLRLVQLLQEDRSQENFLEFLQAMADGMKFEKALDRAYGNRFRSVEIFEQKFKEVVVSKFKPVGEK